MRTIFRGHELHRTLSAFRRDLKASTAITFSLAAIPMMFVVGAGVDYSLGLRARANLEAMTDAAVLATTKQVTATTTQAQMRTIADRYLQATAGTQSVSLKAGSPTLNSTTGELCVEASSIAPTMFSGLMGHQSITVGAKSCAVVASGSFEIALVLDTTGSMGNYDNAGQTKLTSMKNAAKTFIDNMFDSPTLGPRTKMSVVPFAPSVNVGTSYGPSFSVTSTTSYSSINTLSNATGASWFDNSAASAYHWRSPMFASDTATAVNRFALFNALKKQRTAWGWGGCVESLPYPYNISDDPPSATNPDTYFVPMLAPDEPADISHTETYYDSRGRQKTRTVIDATYDNSYIGDTGSCSTTAPTANNTAAQTTAQSRLCKYKSYSNAVTSNGPNAFCVSKPLIRMQTAKADLKTLVDSLTSGGKTNIHEGFMWGWRTISPNAPFADGRAYNTNGNQKIIVLMTDGMNTWSSIDNALNGSEYSAYGFYNSANPKLPTTHQNVTSDSTARAAMDQLTRNACAAAKAKGVIIYTIAFSVNSDPIDAQGMQLLKDCATTEQHHYFAPNSQTTLSSAFTAIGTSITKLRLSH